MRIGIVKYLLIRCHYDPIELYFYSPTMAASSSNVSIPTESFYGRQRGNSRNFHVANIPSDSSDDSSSEEEWNLDASVSTSDTDNSDSSTSSASPSPKKKGLPNKKGQSKKKQTPKQTETSILEKSHLWKVNVDNPLAQNSPIFIGPERKVYLKGDSPLSLFEEVYTEKFLEGITYNTNLYATQNGKKNLKLTVQELKVYLGIRIMMTYIKYPRIRQYWSSAKALRMNMIADAMRVNRFEEITRYLHFIDNNNMPDTNSRLVKLKPVLDHLSTIYRQACDVEEHLSIDEMMIPFKGHSSLKQYIKSKPKPWGFKVWVLAGTSGYVYKFEVYEGAGNNRGLPSKEFGACGDVVLRLCSDLPPVNHKVYCDNLFTSFNLLLKLQEQQIYGVGTVRRNRLAGAQSKLLSQKELDRQGRGSHSVATSVEGVTAVRWFDNNLVHVLSTYAGIEPQDMAARWCKKNKVNIEVPRPYAIQVYNEHMGGVDLMDMLISLYRANTRGKRWYLRIFFHFLNLSIVNLWLLHRIQGFNNDLLDFKSEIATSLILCNLEPQRKRGRPSNDDTQSSPSGKKRTKRTVVPADVRFDGRNHYAKVSLSKYSNRCSLDICTRKTKYACGKCSMIPLCPECFEVYHTK